jgi:spermidine/putrescine ABC transporter ATP-binding subunit
MEGIVNFRNITKRFGEVVALNDVSLDVHGGEFMSLLGPSGCGKTTLLRTCAGLEEPTAGRVYLEERDVTHVPPYRRPVNMVFQRWALFPHRTVAENIGFGLEIKKVPRGEIQRRVAEMLVLVKMEGYGNRYPKQLSGGQAQRVALARALVMKPRVLLLDEPLGSLDLKLRREMQLELINIHRQLRTTFIYVTHDQEEALTMSDRIVLMNSGKIVQDGSPKDIYQRPTSVFAAEFIGETALFPGEVVSSSPSDVCVRSGDLMIRCQPHPGAAPRREAWVSVRPERIQIDCVPVPADNMYEGLLEHVIFKGAAAHYQVRVGSDHIITVQQNLERDVPLYLEQSTVYLSWSLENSVLLLN